MKATGIVRRIDDLGRVVIPKEIRRTLRIKEGTPLEIFTDREGEIILKKYSPIGELNVFAKEYAEALAQSSGMVACITAQDLVGSELCIRDRAREAEIIWEKRSVGSWRKQYPEENLCLQTGMTGTGFQSRRNREIHCILRLCSRLSVQEMLSDR